MHFITKNLRSNDRGLVQRWPITAICTFLTKDANDVEKRVKDKVEG